MALTRIGNALVRIGGYLTQSLSCCFRYSCQITGENECGNSIYECLATSCDDEEGTPAADCGGCPETPPCRYACVSVGGGTSQCQPVQDGPYATLAECEEACVPGVPGCTNPYAPNFNPLATCDDGSCLTCCNQGLCVLRDFDCSLGCNSLTQEEGCNDDPFGTFCLDCCDSFCQDGCPGQSAPDDCSPTFASGFFVSAENACSGVAFTYANCFDCDVSPPP